MAQKLTDRDIKKLPAPATGNKITYDSEVTGLGIRITAPSKRKPDGARAFILNYRVQGREERYTIGDFPDWSIGAAREEAKRLKREMVDRGISPLEQRRKARIGDTISNLADKYLADHVAHHNKPSSAREFTRIVEKVIKPRIGQLKVEAVTRQDIAKLHRQMAKTPRMANQTLAVISKMMNLAELWGLRLDHSNPVKHVQRYKETPRERFLSGDELARVGTVIEQMEDEDAILPAVAAGIRFLALTGLRLSEALGAKWSHVDLDVGLLHLPDAKAGARVVPLGAPALAVLAELDQSTEYVFQQASGEPFKPHHWERAWVRIRGRATVLQMAEQGDARLRKLISDLTEKLDRTPTYREVRRKARTSKPAIELPVGLTDARLHDLRHGYGTLAGGAGLNAFLIRDLLGHRTLAMTGRYVNRHTDPLRAAADQVSGQVAAAMRGRSAGDVTPFRKGGAA